MLKRYLRLSAFFAMLCAGVFMMLPEASAQSVRILTLTGKLRYKNGSPGKSFTWRLKYYPRTGLCIGRVTDRDGIATFDGSYNRRTGTLRLVKRFTRRSSGRRVFFYRGRVTRTGAFGTAHLQSYYGRSYATWSARLLFSTYRSRIRSTKKKMVLSGRLTYRNGRSKAFTWTMTYDKSTGVCMGKTSDRDGRARFDGTYDFRSRRFYLVKDFVMRRPGPKKKFYYKGIIVGNKFIGTAHMGSFYGTRYATWSAKVLYSRNTY